MPVAVSSKLKPAGMVILIITMVCPVLNAATPALPTWVQTYANATVARDEKTVLLQALGDGGLVAGACLDNSRPWIYRLDAGGKILWQRTAGPMGCSSVIRTPEGNIYALGYRWVMALDASGELLWRRAFEGGASNVMFLTGGVGTGDGGLLLIGTWRGAGGSGDNDMWAMRIDAEGRVLWSRTYALPGDEAPQEVVRLAGGSFVVMSGCTSVDHSASFVWLLSLDSTGKLLWSQTAYDAAGSSIAPAGEGGFLLGGLAGKDRQSLLVAQLDAQGLVQWKSGIPPANEYRYTASTVVLQEGADIYAMTSDSGGRLYKFTVAGKLSWERKFSAGLTQRLRAAARASDGGLVVVSDDYLTVAGAFDKAWLFRLDDDGEVGGNCSLIQAGKVSNATISLTFTPVAPQVNDLAVSVSDEQGELSVSSAVVQTLCWTQGTIPSLPAPSPVSVEGRECGPETLTAAADLGLGWTEVSGAARYRVEVYRGVCGEALQASLDTVGAEAGCSLPTIGWAAGEYRWRVFAYGDGVQALNSAWSDCCAFAFGTVPEHSHDYWIPVVTHGAGAYGSVWRSDLSLLNTSEEAASVSIFTTAPGANNQARTIPPHGQLLIPDVAAVMGFEGSSPLRISASVSVVATVRTYNLTSDGTYGQFMVGGPAGGGLKEGDRAYLPQLMQTSDFRSNLGFTNAGTTPAQISLLYVPDVGYYHGEPVSIPPGQFVQLQQPLASLNGTFPAAYARLTVDYGNDITAFASIVDNRTNDAFTMPVVFWEPATARSGAEAVCQIPTQATTFEYWLPVASHAEGAYGSQWRTDIGVLNPDDGNGVRVDLAWLAPGGTVPYGTTIPPFRQTIFGDMVGYMGQTGAAAMRITTNHPVVVTSRTYNASSQGTFGQYLGSYRTDEGLTAGQTAYLPQLAENASFRTNIAMTNTGNSAARVRVRMIDGEGAPLGQYEADLAAGQFKQEIRPFWAYGGKGDLTSGSAVVEVLQGSGIIAYASVVDNNTNDAYTVPMLQ